MLLLPLNQCVDYSEVYPITEDLRDSKIIHHMKKGDKVGRVVRQAPATLTIKWEDGKTSKLCVAYPEDVSKYSIVVLE